MPLAFDIAGFESCPRSRSRPQHYVCVSGRSVAGVIREDDAISELQTYTIKDRDPETGQLDRVLLQTMRFVAEVSAIYIIGRRRDRVEPGIGCVLELKGDDLEGVIQAAQAEISQDQRIFFQLISAA